MTVAVLTRVAAVPSRSPSIVEPGSLVPAALCQTGAKGPSALGNLTRGGFVTGSTAVWNDGVMPVNP
jgi:hypothetical protein